MVQEPWVLGSALPQDDSMAAGWCPLWALVSLHMKAGSGSRSLVGPYEMMPHVLDLRGKPRRADVEKQSPSKRFF